jgi:hypothetical protein
MALPIRPTNPNTPIPNNPFYAPLNPYVNGPYFPVDLGSGIDMTTGATTPTLVNNVSQVLVAGPGIALSTSGTTTTISALGPSGPTVSQIIAGTNVTISPAGGTGVVTINAQGGGSGTVTAISAGNGLTGGTITTTGTIALNAACVVGPNAFNIKGNVLVGTGPGAYTALNPGTDGQVLIACNASNASGLCWGNVGSVTTVSGVAPISVATGSTTPSISIAAASTSAAGAVQLNDTLSSTSTTQALTAAQGKVLQDQINTLVASGGVTLAGTVDASTGFVASVTTNGTNAGYVVGSILPAASATTNNTYVIVTTPGTLTPPGGTPTIATRGDWFLVTQTSPGVYAWTFLNVGFDAPAASTTTPGIVQLATNAQTITGTDATLAVTPAGAAAAYVPLSALTAKGAIVSATAASTPSTLTVGGDGQVLTACSTATTGLCWTTPASSGIPCACITAKGTIVTGTAAATPTALPVGSDGYVLTACSTAATGLCWTAASVPAIPCACVTGKGALITGTSTGTPVGLTVGADGQALIACSTSINGLCWVTLPVISQATPTVLGTVYGKTPGASDVTGNLSLGYNAGNAITTGVSNTLIGVCSGGAVTSGIANVALGNCAITSVTTGIGNIAVGFCAGKAIVGGCGNVALGGCSQVAVTTGSGNVATGVWSLLCNVTGTGNVAVGNCALWCSTGSQNVGIGYLVQVANTAGSCQLAIGFDAGQYWLTGTSSKAIKPGAGIIDCGNSCGTNGQVLMSNGSNAVCWGSLPANNAIPCACITAKGSLITGTAANTPVALTVGSDGQVLAACSTAPFGICWSAAPVPCACYTARGDLLAGTGVGTFTQVPIGTNSQILTAVATKFGCCITWCDPVGQATFDTLGLVYGIDDGQSNVSIGNNSLNAITTGGSNTALGTPALTNLDAGNDNVGVGFCAGQCLTGQSNNVAIGSWSGGYSTFSNSVIVGACAGYAGGTGSVVVGYAALASTTLGVDNSVIIGSNALNDNAYSGNQLVAIGPNVCLPDFNGSCQLAIGYAAGSNWLTGDCTLAIKPGAGIIDCAGSCGSSGQILYSTGSNAIQWASPGASYSGYNGYKSAVTSGTKFNVTGWPRERGLNWIGQLNIFTTYGTDPSSETNPASNALIFVNGYNGVGTTTVQAFNTSSGVFTVEANSYPAYTDTTIVFTPSVTTDRMNFYIRYLDSSGNGGPSNSPEPFSSYLTIF